MFARHSSLQKTPFPMLFTPAPIVTLVRLQQSENACTPMVVTLSGISILVRPLHPAKAISSIIFTLSGIVISVRLEQIANAP